MSETFSLEDINPTKMSEEDTEEDAGTHEASPADGVHPGLNDDNSTADRYFPSPCHSNKVLHTLPRTL